MTDFMTPTSDERKKTRKDIIDFVAGQKDNLKKAGDFLMTPIKEQPVIKAAGTAFGVVDNALDFISPDLKDKINSTVSGGTDTAYQARERNINSQIDSVDVPKKTLQVGDVGNEQVPGTGAIRNEKTGETVSMDSSGKITTTDKNGAIIQGPSEKISAAGSTGIPKQTSPKYAVEFDPSVPQDRRDAFMAPVPPQANHYVPDNGSQGRQASLNADRILHGSGGSTSGPGISELFTRENSPGMGWQQRMRLNEQLLQNSQSGRNAELQAQTHIAVGEGSNATQLENTRLQQQSPLIQAQAANVLADTQLAPARKKLTDLRVKLAEQGLQQDETAAQGVDLSTAILDARKKLQKR